MKRIPLNLQTLFADLAQSAAGETVRAASVQVKTVKGRKYYYAQEKIGRTFHLRALGPVGAAEAERKAEDLRGAGTRARERRKLVTMIKNAGVPAPTGDMARLIEAVSSTGLFARGVVLVGTGAYQIYPCLVGAVLGAVALATRDADLAVATLAVANDAPLIDVLREADPSYQAVMGLDGRAAPKKFRNEAGFEIDVLTPVRTRHDKNPAALPGLGAGATPIQFLQFLIEDAVSTVALIGSGVPVTVPQPARFAVHKLIVAQSLSRPPEKRSKDLAQAHELMTALGVSNPWAVRDALDDARGRGAKWRLPVDRSLAELEITPPFVGNRPAGQRR